MEAIREDRELEIEGVTNHLAWSRERAADGEAAGMSKGVQVKLRCAPSLGSEKQAEAGGERGLERRK